MASRPDYRPAGTSMKDHPVIGLDIGGTKVMAGVIRPGRGRPEVAAVESFPTPRNRDAAGRSINGAVKKIMSRFGNKVSGIGVAAPGPYDPRRKALLRAPNLPGWENWRLGAWLERKFGLPVRMENDANAAALAEALWGAGKNYRFVFYSTISTGIGSGFVIDKRLFTGRTGMALEGGHLSIDYRGRPCLCGLQGCIEAYASGPSLVRRAKEILGPIAYSWTAEDIFRKARNGDGKSLRLVQETGNYLGVWLGNLVNIFDPDVIILGGGLSNGLPSYIKPLRAAMNKSSINPGAKNVPVIRARLGPTAGLLGAAAIFWQNQGNS